MKQRLLLLSLVFFSSQLKAQPKVSEVTPGVLNIGGGSSAINSSFIVDWSIGESTMIETFYGQNSYANTIVGLKWNVTSGVLQPYDKNRIIFNSSAPYWTIQEIRLYPIPTPNTVYIDFRSNTTGKITMQLMTLDGRLLGIKEFTQVNGHSIQSWDLKNKAAGFYFLRIILSADDGKILKQGTFKIERI